jgi:hypothetical protein
LMARLPAALLLVLLPLLACSPVDTNPVKFNVKQMREGLPIDMRCFCLCCY